MKFSQLYAPTLREDPADAEVASHRLMLRAGMIRKLAAGIYSYLPLGYRAIRKVEQIVREEMDRAGAQEVLLPAVQPAELWQESGRWTQYGPELLRFKDRGGRDFCLGPTHEEVITDLVRHEIRSYRDLPKNLYQIQTKFRDEIRPRFGLMRGREFIMKDAYSFDADEPGAEESYRRMADAYHRIFRRCGLRFRAVEADTGNIGGSFSHEFMVLADSGEDAIAASDGGDYAANVEKAELPDPGGVPMPGDAPLRRVQTPGRTTIEEVSAFLGCEASDLVKTLVFQTDHGPVAALVRGDHEVNPLKLAKVLGVTFCEPAEAEVVERVTGAPVGFAGPLGLAIPVVADHAVRAMRDFVVGANEKDAHLVGVNLGRDFPVPRFADLRFARDGDPSPRDGGRLRIFRGIEVGHIFKLGEKYSRALRATFLDVSGQERPLVMGCYGIGIGRTVAAAIEQHHDEAGIRFPVPIAPFEAVIVTLYAREGRAQVDQAAERLYRELQDRGVEVLWDDRDERPGAKFKDADLIGIPIRITIGQKALAQGQVELKRRTEKDFALVPAHEAAARVAEIVREAKRADP